MVCLACEHEFLDENPGPLHLGCAIRVVRAAFRRGIGTAAISEALGVALDELREHGLWRKREQQIRIRIQLTQTLRDQLETLARRERLTLWDMATLLVEEAIAAREESERTPLRFLWPTYCSVCDHAECRCKK